MAFNIPNRYVYPWHDLLNNHIGQLINPNQGGINTWTSSPNTGIDGQSLSINHTGYTGYNLSTYRMERWDGTKWETLFISPLQGEIVHTSTWSKSIPSGTAWNGTESKRINFDNELIKESNYIYLMSGLGVSGLDGGVAMTYDFRNSSDNSLFRIVHSLADNVNTAETSGVTIPLLIPKPLRASSILFTVTASNNISYNYGISSTINFMK